VSIRKIALVAGLSGLLTIVTPLWSLTHLPVGRIPAIYTLLTVILVLGTLIVPVFDLALFANSAPIRLPRNLKRLALIAAIVFGAVAALGVPDLLESLMSLRNDVQLGGGGIAILASKPILDLVAEISNLAFILLLVALYRTPDGAPEEPVSAFLEVTSRIAVILCGLGMIYALVLVGYAPYGYEQVRQMYLTRNAAPPALWQVMARPMKTLLDTACIWVAPYVISMSQRGLAITPQPGEREPTPHPSPDPDEPDEPDMEPRPTGVVSSES
jgi:hypothetical protein